MSKVNNILNLITKNSINENHDLIKSLFSENETDLINEIKNMKAQLTSETSIYTISYIMIVMEKLSSSIYYYNDGIDGVFNKDTPILEEAITIIKNTAKQARDLWISLIDKN